MFWLVHDLNRGMTGIPDDIPISLPDIAKNYTNSM